MHVSQDKSSSRKVNQSASFAAFANKYLPPVENTLEMIDKLNILRKQWNKEANLEKTIFGKHFNYNKVDDFK